MLITGGVRSRGRGNDSRGKGAVLRGGVGLVVLPLAMAMAACADMGRPAAPDADPGAGPPPGVIEIEAPEPKEISGVAAVPGGYAVVGDETNDHGRIWPGGARWEIAPEVAGPESVDVGFGPDGRELWLVLGEDGRSLAEMGGRSFVLPERYKEVCGRGLEGLALRWDGAAWRIAVLWEGGFYEPEGQYDGRACPPPERFAQPRIALLRWRPGAGTNGIDREIELDVPRPATGERFRAPDLVWDGDGFLVLLSSMNSDNRGFSHTWLQKFDLAGQPVGAPLMLEEAWGEYRKNRNWEALDWTLDGKRLVMGFDAEKGRQILVVFPASSR